MVVATGHLIESSAGRDATNLSLGIRTPSSDGSVGPESQGVVAAGGNLDEILAIGSAGNLPVEVEAPGIKSAGLGLGGYGEQEKKEGG